MKKSSSYLLVTIFMLLTTVLSSCEAIAGIFKAGVWVGVIAVVGIIALIFYLVGRKK